MAFKQWEAMQNVGSPQMTADRSYNVDLARDTETDTRRHVRFGP